MAGDEGRWSKEKRGMHPTRTCSTISIVTSPAEGMAAAPMAASVAVTATTIVPPTPSATPCACRDAIVKYVSSHPSLAAAAVAAPNL